MSCSYSNIAIQYFDVKALEYTPATILWKRFRDDTFIVWPHSIDELDIFFDYITWFDLVDPTKKIQLTMEVAADTLELLDLKLKFHKESKQISVDVFAKDTDSFTYVLPSTCFPKNNIPKGVALHLRRICDFDKKFEKHSAEYQNYLIARDYKPGKVKKTIFRH